MNIKETRERNKGLLVAGSIIRATGIISLLCGLFFAYALYVTDTNSSSFNSQDLMIRWCASHTSLLIWGGTALIAITIVIMMTVSHSDTIINQTNEPVSLDELKARQLARR